MIFKKLKFTGHAIRQMFLRRISETDVKAVVSEGEVIKEYADDKPFPSMLLLGLVNNRPIHVVVACDEDNETGYVITTYEPDPGIWAEDFKRRK